MGELCLAEQDACPVPFIAGSNLFILVENRVNKALRNCLNHFAGDRLHDFSDNFTDDLSDHVKRILHRNTPPLFIDITILVLP